jgi:hypothetical protein
VEAWLAGIQDECRSDEGGCLWSPPTTCWPGKEGGVNDNRSSPATDALIDALVTFSLGLHRLFFASVAAMCSVAWLGFIWGCRLGYGKYDGN